MNKIIILIGVLIFSYIAIILSIIWIVIEMISSIFKDTNFNWWSVFALIISIIILVASLVISAIATAKHESNNEWKYDKLTKKHRNNFQKRLDEMREQPENNKK